MGDALMEQGAFCLRIRGALSAALMWVNLLSSGRPPDRDGHSTVLVTFATRRSTTETERLDLLTNLAFRRQLPNAEMGQRDQFALAQLHDRYRQ